MNILKRYISLLGVALRRMWSHRLLMACLAFGLITAVALLSSVPLYADATQNRLLQGELTEAGTYRPPFSFMWRYIGAWNGEKTLEEVADVDTYLSERAAGIMGLSVDQTIRHISTTKLRLFPDEASGFNENAPLLWANVGFVTGFEDAVRLVEGVFPEQTTVDGAIPIMVSRTTADRLGLQVGETYTLFTPGTDGAELPLQVVGVWTPVNPESSFWFYPPDTFDEMLITSESIFREQVAINLELPVSTAVWYLILDGRSVRPSRVDRLLNSINTIEARANALLNGITLDVSPVEALQSYEGTAGILTLTLTIFSLPVVGLVLYFVSLIASMVVKQERNEIAIMRSRGISRGQVLSIYAIEAAVLAIFGLAAGLVVGSWLAQLMGRTRTFLDTAVFSNIGNENLVTVISGTALSYAGLAVALTLIAIFAPALQNASHTIVTLRSLQARDLRQPFWQRYFLDVILLIFPFYGWYQLDQQGSLTVLGAGNDPFSNPLLFLVPVLFCFGLGLLSIRFFPYLMGFLAWSTQRVVGTTLLIMLRQLARSAKQYTGPLLLLTLTLSLATFTASMAVTLDDHLFDQLYYRWGADLHLVEQGESTRRPEQPNRFGNQNQQQNQDDDEENEDEARFLFLPVEEHLDVAGVKAAARVGDYRAVSTIGGREQDGRILGIDRLDFTQVAYYRRDFAGNESLGGVLNRLAVGREYILVDQRFMAQYGLNVGDPLQLRLVVDEEEVTADFIIAAPLDLWPTQYPSDGPFFVAHLDYLHERLGGQYPYNVWLATDENTPSAEIVQGVRDLGLIVVSADDTREIIAEEQQRPERQGLFGILSVGFGAAAILTVLGFLVFSVISFQRRYIELGMLRAIGLSVGQMVTYLAGEQATLILSGTAVGTFLGVWASRLFIPFFQIGDDKTALVPSFVVKIAWPQIGLIYLVFSAMFLVAITVLIILLLRMKVFEAVKLGETV